MTHTARLQRRTSAAGTGGWRRWNLVVLTALTAYSTGVAWQAQQVSYPLFRAVDPQTFADYHHRYNKAIPLVVIVPGFACFLSCIAFSWSRPHDVSRPAAAMVSLSGVASLLSTVLWAIPMHDRLDAVGQDAATIEGLRDANRVRTASLTVGTLVLCWCVGRHASARLPESGLPHPYS